MSFFYNHCGISISESKLQLVEVKYSDNNFIIENVEEEYFNEFLDFNFKETKFISILQSAFNNIIFRKPINAEYISFSLPLELFYINKIPIESTYSPKEQIEYYKW